MIRKIHVKVKPNSPEQKIEDFGDYRYLVYVCSEAENNEANVEMLNMLAKHLGVPATKLEIVSGRTNKDKVIEIQY